MIRFFLISILGWLINLNSYAYSDSTEIIWCSCKELNWSDFQNSSIDSVGGDAKTFTDVRIYIADTIFDDNYTQNFKLEILAIFSRQKSFTRFLDERLLRHEQLHFDISELIARKLREKVSNRKINDKNYSEIVLKELLPLKRKLINDINKLYDDETGHGQIEIEQSRWINYVRDELLNLEDYSTPCTSEFLNECNRFETRGNFCLRTVSEIKMGLSKNYPLYYIGSDTKFHYLIYNYEPAKICSKIKINRIDCKLKVEIFEKEDEGFISDFPIYIDELD